ALAEGGRPDARPEADQYADEHFDWEPGGAGMAKSTQYCRPGAVRAHGLLRLVTRRRVGGIVATLVLISGWTATLLAQLDPLLFIKRVSPTVIVVMARSV